MAGAGVLLGIAIALITARFVQSMLYGITADDGASLAIAILVLTMVALFAGFLPARRASRLDPMAALRYE
jgi:ABC-type antimicrobial peptide transport system permease subunit